MYHYLRLPLEAFSAWTSWAAQTEVRKYGNALTVNIITIAIQILLVIVSGSLALRSDTFHLGSDMSFTASLFFVALWTLTLNEQKEKLVRISFAYFGIGLLAFGAVHILLEVPERIVSQQNIANGWVLTGGILGATGNAFVYAILHKTNNHEDDHLHSVFEWHVIFDFLFSVVVACSALTALFFGMQSIDTYVSIILAIFMLCLCVHLIKKVRRGENPH